jgi:hypothetical protein
LAMYQIQARDLNWTDEEKKELEIIWKLDPATSTCDLATIMDKPCWEVWIVHARLSCSEAGYDGVGYKAASKL